MAKRIITAVVGLPVLIGLLYLGGYYVMGVCIILSVIGMNEYVRGVNKILDHPIKYVFTMLLAAIIVVAMKFNYNSTVPVILICLIIVFCGEIFGGNHDLLRGVATVFGLVYIPVLFGHLQLFDALPNGVYYMWMVFVIAFSTDTFAYFIGMFFGKRKLAPAISPKKTVAGAIGGVVFAVLAMVAYSLILQKGFNINLPMIPNIIVGFIGSVAGQCGDLTASMIKRETGIKDFGTCLPGHGGILDRFDSILFIIPVVYLYAIYTFGYL